MYCGALWTNFKAATLNKLKVSYNDVMRKLTNYPRYESVSLMFVNLRVKTFQELKRTLSYSCMSRVTNSSNNLIDTLNNSDVKTSSRLWHSWSLDLLL